jgi:NO-binding membrane sensor protein with MHYT domain
MDPRYVAASVGISVLGSYTACNAAEVYRSSFSTRTKQAALGLFSVNIGGVSIWAMHAIAMYARRSDDCYNPGLVALSAVLAVTFVHAGALIATNDAFFGRAKSDNLSVLKVRGALVARRVSRLVGPAAALLLTDLLALIAALLARLLCARTRST